MDSQATHTVANANDVLLRLRGATVTVTKGPDAGRTVKIEQPTFLIGKGDAADLQLTDPSVSREHLRLALMPNGIQLRDTSKNGTKIGGLRVVEAILSADAVLSLGQTTLNIAIDAEPLTLPLSTSVTFGEAIGSSPVMRHLFAVLEQGAASEITILLEGESGVGKDVLARAVHQASPRKDGPFVVVDCGAIPPNLIESELFGHEKGSFTGAEGTRRGVFEEANGGTLFLDEIGELPLELQPKLLRALEAREYRPVGARATKKLDARIIAATNRKLAECVKRGEFREDLYYRLAVVRAHVPPLRDRQDDIVPIALAMLRRLRGDEALDLPPDFAAVLREYSWPGNVRELRNVVERFALMGIAPGQEDFITAGSGPNVPAAEWDVLNLPYHEARKVVLERFERRYLPTVLERANGVIARAAEIAQVARPSFYRMLERLNLSRNAEADRG